MPGVDQKAGSCYVWIITAFLFICIAGGGALLAIYMSQPEVSSCYPIAGISLVCLPWLFWLLTFLYRLLSRRFGFRLVFWGASADSLPRTASSTAAVAGSTSIANGGEGDNHRDDTGTKTTALEAGTAGRPATTANGGRRVHFGGAVVVGEEHDGDGSLPSPAVSSEGSEAPLRFSMAA